MKEAVTIGGTAWQLARVSKHAGGDVVGSAFQPTRIRLVAGSALHDRVVDSIVAWVTEPSADIGVEAKAA